MSSKILLIPDFPNWALDKNAKDLVKYNNSSLQLDIQYYNDYLSNWEKYYNEYDILFPMYMGSFFDMLDKKLPVDKVITGIRSFKRWDEGKTLPPGFNSKPPRKVIKKLRKALLVNTVCQKLWYIFSDYFRIIHTKYTCDLELYYPEKKKKQTDKLIVGWAGSLSNHGKKRGFYEFIKPICDEIPEIELKVQAKEDKFVTDDNEMREFYNSLDLYFSASRVEGAGRPVIEAAACGIPVISTDVGIIPELIEHNNNGFIVDRNYEAMRTQLKAIVNEREKLPEMGENIRRKIEAAFNWEKVITQWTDYFQLALEIKKLRNSGVLK